MTHVSCLKCDGFATAMSYNHAWNFSTILTLEFEDWTAAAILTSFDALFPFEIKNFTYSLSKY